MSANLALLAGAGEARPIELPDPGAPGPGQVRLRMLYAPVNPADLLAIAGGYAFALDPDVPLGAEGVGMVEAVGPDVAAVTPGTLALPLSRGNWCRARVIDRDAIILVPVGIDVVRAAMLRINPVTASLLLDASLCGPGDLLAQNAAGSSVAQWVRFLAVQRGISVIDILRRPNPVLPDALIDGPDVAADILRLTGGRRVQAALDCVAGLAAERVAEAMAPKGRILVFGHLSGEPVTMRSQLLTAGTLSVTGFSQRPAEAELGPAGVARLFASIFAALERDGPDPAVGAIVPLSQADRAITMARAGAAGRVLFDLTQ